MVRAKRVWTDEQKKAFGAKMKALREKKLAEQVVEPAVTEVERNVELDAAIEETPPEVTNVPEPTTEDILKRALEAIATLAQLTGQNQATAGINANGKLTGTVLKYSLDPSRYPDPTERLSNEQRLGRFGFKENYELRWEITSSEYTTIDNIRMREPKFILDLVKVVYNEDTGVKTNGRYVLYRMVMHEDPDSALTVARQNGVDVDNFEEAAFLNEMRYLQMRDWLVECFYKPTSTTVTNKREMVIDGKLVEYFEVSSKDNAKIPFAELDTKV